MVLGGAATVVGGATTGAEVVVVVGGAVVEVGLGSASSQTRSSWASVGATGSAPDRSLQPEIGAARRTANATRAADGRSGCKLVS